MKFTLLMLLGACQAYRPAPQVAIIHKQEARFDKSAPMSAPFDSKNYADDSETAMTLASIKESEK